MTHRRFPLLALVLALSACTNNLPAGNGVTPAPSSPPKSVKPTETAIRPTGEPTAAIDPKPAGVKLPLLQAPASGTVPMTGTVAIDAHYAVNAAGAKLIGLDGSTLIGTDGTTLIGLDGSTLIGTDGASAVNVAAGLIGLDGGSLIGLDGSTLIGLDGSTLVAAGAGNLIGKRKLDLMQAKAPEKFNIGSVLPAAAMELEIRSLETGKPIALGVDDKGQPVFTILTNAKGGYSVHLPVNVAGKSLIITARVPGTTDERVIYNSVASEGAKSAVVDEDTALATSYFREAFVSRLVRLANRETGNIGGGATALLPDSLASDPALEATFKPLVEAAHKAYEEDKVGGRTVAQVNARQRARARTTADVLLAQIDLAALNEPSSGRPVLDVLRDALKAFRDAATKKMRAQPDYFNGPDATLVVAANRRRAQANATLPAAERQPEDAVRFVVRRPSDVGQLVLEEVLMADNRRTSSEGLRLAFEMVEFPGDTKEQTLEQLYGAMDALLGASGVVLIANAPMEDGRPVLDAAVEAMGTTPAGLE